MGPTCANSTTLSTTAISRKVGRKFTMVDWGTVYLISYEDNNLLDRI